MLAAAGFGQYQFEKQINKYRKHYRGKGGKGYLIPAHVAQKISSSVWDGYKKLLFGNGKQVWFSKWSEFTTIAAKTNASGIRYADGTVSFNGMRLQVSFERRTLTDTSGRRWSEVSVTAASAAAGMLTDGNTLCSSRWMVCLP